MRSMPLTELTLETKLYRIELDRHGGAYASGEGVAGGCVVLVIRHGCSVTASVRGRPRE